MKIFILIILTVSANVNAGTVSYFTSKGLVTVNNCRLNNQFISGYEVNHYFFSCKGKLEKSIFSDNIDSMIWIGRKRLACKLDEFIMQSKINFNMHVDCT